ncbi:MAG: efflux RND transporter periplasmic adaptor subunit [Desulfoplanes sp.]|nr:efflux RND transporter periplasmic adaptor subunit [Desulfoplanes sp.]
MKRYLFWIFCVVLVAGGYVVYAHWFAAEPFPDGLIQANGRIEGDHVTLSSKYAGRIKRLLAREGDRVVEGQKLALLDDERISAQGKQADKAVASLEARIRAAETDLSRLEKHVPLNIEIAKTAVSQSRDRVAELEATCLQNKRDAERFQQLAAQGLVDTQKSEIENLRYIVSRRQLQSGQTTQERSVKELEQARLGWNDITARKADIQALYAQKEEALAAREEVQAVLDDLTIVSPCNGTVTTRIAEQGEVISAGSPILEIVDMNRLYLKVYVPETDKGHLALGLPARIYTDAFPDKPVPASVRYIGSEAEFTPKEVQTPDERVKFVYEVKLYLDENPQGHMTPGLPADAVIRWKQGMDWVRPHW